MIYLVGMGMGNPALLTEEAREAIRRSDRLIGSKRLLQEIDHPRKHIAIRHDEILSLLELGENTAVLLSGDPGFFSGAARLQQLKKEYCILPGISSLQYFAARLQRSWETIQTISLHGRRERIDLTGGGSFFFLCDAERNPAWIARKLLEEQKEAVLFVGEDLSLPGERIRSGSPEAFLEGTFSGLSVVIADIEKEQRPLLLQDEAFVRNQTPMTKEELRLYSLLKMDIQPGECLLDIGSGTGSMALQMGRLFPTCDIYAIERDERALTVLRQNLSLFGGPITILEGDVMDLLSQLPQADRVFIGGSGGNLPELLDFLKEKTHVKKIVLNFVTLENCLEALQNLSSWEYELVQLQASRAKNIGKLHMMQGMNPIFILSARRM